MKSTGVSEAFIELYHAQREKHERAARRRDAIVFSFAAVVLVLMWWAS